MPHPTFEGLDDWYRSADGDINGPMLRRVFEGTDWFADIPWLFWYMSLLSIEGLSRIFFDL